MGRGIVLDAREHVIIPSERARICAEQCNRLAAVALIITTKATCRLMVGIPIGKPR